METRKNQGYVAHAYCIFNGTYVLTAVPGFEHSARHSEGA